MSPRDFAIPLLAACAAFANATNSPPVIHFSDLRAIAAAHRAANPAPALVTPPKPITNAVPLSWSALQVRRTLNSAQTNRQSYFFGATNIAHLQIQASFDLRSWWAVTNLPLGASAVHLTGTNRQCFYRLAVMYDYGL